MKNNNKSKLLILGVVSNKYDGSYFNGVTTVVENLAESFNEKYEVFIYATNVRKNIVKNRDSKCKIYGNNKLYILLSILLLCFRPLYFSRLISNYKKKFGMKPLRMISYRIMVKRIIKKIEPEVIHAHGPHFAVILAEIKNKIPVVTTYHDIPYMNKEAIDINNERGINISKFYIESAKFVNFFTCLNKTKHTDLLKIDSSKNNSRYFRIIGNGINLEKFYLNSINKSISLKEELKIPKGKKVFITVASLTKRKGHIRFIKFIYENSLDVIYLIIGKGPEKKRLESEVNKYNLQKNVYFLGVVDNSKLYKYYSISNSFVLPSTSEGQAMCILEAMACGLDVYVDKNIIDTLDFKAVAKQYINLIDFKSVNETESILSINKFDVRKKISKSMQIYSWNNISNKYIMFFEDVVERKRKYVK